MPNEDELRIYQNNLLNEKTRGLGDPSLRPDGMYDPNFGSLPQFNPPIQLPLPHEAPILDNMPLPPPLEEALSQGLPLMPWQAPHQQAGQWGGQANMPGMIPPIPQLMPEIPQGLNQPPGANLAGGGMGGFQ